MKINRWAINDWNRELTQNQVIVMTPQIFLNMLSNFFINLSQINLLIVDECHWAARKRSPIQADNEDLQIKASQCSSTSFRPIREFNNSSIKLEMFYNSVTDLEKTCNAVCITSYLTELCGTNPEGVVCSYDSRMLSKLWKN